MFTRRVDEGLELELLHDRLAEPLFRSVDHCRAYLGEWLSWVDQTSIVADTREFIRLSGFAFSEGLALRCAIRCDGVICGSVSLEDIRRASDAAEIGYWLDQRYQGRGIVTRCVTELSRLAFEDLGLHRLTIRVATGNHKSAAIPERLGWTFEGVLREQESLRGTRLDMRLYSLLRDEFSGATSAPSSTRQTLS